MKLHQKQIEDQLKRFAIDAIVSLIYEVEQQWFKKKLAAALFIDVKKAFDYIFIVQLIAQMLKLGVNEDLICWIKSILIDQKL